MHASDRTMLSSLGFADKDKKNPTHDLACLYLSQPATIKALLEQMNPPCHGKKVKDIRADMVPTLEYHLQKGEGKYATTVGFLDVVYDVKWSWVDIWTADRDDLYRGYKKGECYEFKHNDACKFFVEVKIEPIGYGEILRQLNLYRSYFPSRLVPGLLVTAWQMSDLERSAILSAGYAHKALGNGFIRWAESQQSKNTKADPGL